MLACIARESQMVRLPDGVKIIKTRKTNFLLDHDLENPVQPHPRPNPYLLAAVRTENGSSQGLFPDCLVSWLWHTWQPNISV